MYYSVYWEQQDGCSKHYNKCSKYDSQIREEPAICSFRKRNSCSVPSLWGARDVTQLTNWSLPSGQDLSAIYTDTPSKNSSLFSSVCLETISRGIPHANTDFRTCQIMLSSFQASASSLQPSLLTSSLSLPLSFLLHSFRGSLPSWSREQVLEPDDQDQNPSSCRLQAV